MHIPSGSNFPLTNFSSRVSLTVKAHFLHTADIRQIYQSWEAGNWWRQKTRKTEAHFGNQFNQVVFRLKDQWNVLAAGNDECWVVGKVSWVCTEPDPGSRMLNIALSAQPFSFLFLQVLARSYSMLSSMFCLTQLAFKINFQDKSLWKYPCPPVPPLPMVNDRPWKCVNPSMICCPGMSLCNSYISYNSFLKYLTNSAHQEFLSL